MMKTLTQPQLVGMVHLPALPGSPAWDGTPIERIGDLAVADSLVLKEAGFDAAMIQNSLDRPTRLSVDLLTVSMMTAIVQRVRVECAIEIGVNVVKNDGPAAIAIAASTGSRFVRVKCLTGSRYGAEGLYNGCAFDTARIRRDSGTMPAIWADIREPTSRSLVEVELDFDVTNALDQGGADGIVITGVDSASTFALATEVRDLRPEAHLIIGGKVSASNVAQALLLAHTVIIGSALKAFGGFSGRNDRAKAQEIAKAAGRLS
jgi:hypothetical protein